MAIVGNISPTLDLPQIISIGRDFRPTAQDPGPRTQWKEILQLMQQLQDLQELINSTAQYLPVGDPKAHAQEARGSGVIELDWSTPCHRFLQ